MLDKKFVMRFCDCRQWKRSDSSDLRKLLQYFPNECPYCHKALQIRKRGILFEVHIESELDGFDDPLDGSSHLTLEEVQGLLSEGINEDIIVGGREMSKVESKPIKHGPRHPSRPPPK